MKFLVKDKQKDRHKKIRSYLTDEDCSIAVLLATIDLEWTIRRSLYALSNASLAELREERISGLDRYARNWEKKLKMDFPLKLEISSWEELKEAFELRNALTHGAQGSSGLKYCTKQVSRMLEASVALYEFGINHNPSVNIYKRLSSKKPKS
jgi:hypothetical protein